MASRSRLGSPMPHDPSRPPILVVVSGDRRQVNHFAAILRDGYELRRAYDGIQAEELVDENVDILLVDPATLALEYDRYMVGLRERGVDCRAALIVGPEVHSTVLAADVDDYVIRLALAESVRMTVDRLAAVATYDGDLREFYELARRKAQLEARLSPEEMETHSEYAELMAELAGYWDLLDAGLRDLDSDRINIVSREFAAVWCLSPGVEGAGTNSTVETLKHQYYRMVYRINRKKLCIGFCRSIGNEEICLLSPKAVEFGIVSPTK